MGKKSHTVSTHAGGIPVGVQPRLFKESKEVREIEKLAAKALNAQESLDRKYSVLKTAQGHVNSLCDLVGEKVKAMGKTHCVVGGAEIECRDGKSKTVIKRVKPQAGESKAHQDDKKGAKKVESKK